MSIATRTGDDGTTGLMFGRRVPKWDAQVEAYGTVDELSSALGVARAANPEPSVNQWIMNVQKRLVGLMGELAVRREDYATYLARGYAHITTDDLAFLDAMVEKLEAEDGLKFDGWATPGATPPAAALDMARTVCRRAERRAIEVDPDTPRNPALIQFLNRLSDCLWLLARKFEAGQDATITDHGMK